MFITIFFYQINIAESPGHGVNTSNSLSIRTCNNFCSKITTENVFFLFPPSIRWDNVSNKSVGFCFIHKLVILML